MDRDFFYIILYKNRKKQRILHKSEDKNLIMKYWKRYDKPKEALFERVHQGKRHKIVKYEVALLFPYRKNGKTVYVRDELGRNVEAPLEDYSHQIRDIRPFHEEETIFDFQTRKRIKAKKLIKHLSEVSEISQIFKLNNKLFLQIDDYLEMYGNKNVDDCSRLFEVVRGELLSMGKSNFIFVRDISTTQRSNLYQLLENMGYNRKELFRHYSY